MNANTIDAPGGRPVLRIVRPTDFSAASDVAFGHALKLALVAGAELDLLHMSRRRSRIGWEAFLGARAALERWGIPQPDEASAPPGSAGLRVGKIVGVESRSLGCRLRRGASDGSGGAGDPSAGRHRALAPCGDGGADRPPLTRDDPVHSARGGWFRLSGDRRGHAARYPGPRRSGAGPAAGRGHDRGPPRWCRRCRGVHRAAPCRGGGEPAGRQDTAPRLVALGVVCP